MGALMRATIVEAGELALHEPGWWREFCGAVAENGWEAVRAEKEMRGWAWGGLWAWINEDEGRKGEYREALKAYAQRLALETVRIADESEDADLRVGTRFKLAGKVDREVWGEKVEHTVGVDPFGEMLRRVSERQLALMRAAQGGERVVSEVAAGAAVVPEGEI